MNFKRVTGDKGELYTKKQLAKQRYKITATNYSCRFGEIDIIAENKEFICFVEVKTRGENSLGTPADAVDYFKQSRLIKTAEHFLLNNPCELQPRFDVAEVIMKGEKIISFNYIANAFYAF